MKSLLFFIIVLSLYSLRSQNMLPVDQGSFVGQGKQHFIFSGVADYQSTSIGKDITRSFFYGGFIDNEMKQLSSDRHDEINRFGLEMNAEFEYRNEKLGLFKDSLIGLIVKGGIYNFSSMIYSKDIFDLAFFGNEMFIGDTANLAGSEFSSVTFQKLGFGLIDKRTRSSLAFNFVGLNNYVQGVFGDSYVYQNQELDSMAVELCGSAERALRNGYFKGLGLALDIDYRFKMKKNKDDHIHFQLLARNFGFAVMKGEKYNSNNSFNYSNYQIDDLINAETIFNDSDELISELSDSSGTRNSIILLPAMFQFSKLIDPMSSKKIQGFFGFRTFLNKAYIPMLFGGLDFRAASWYRIGAQLSYGGFSQLRWGMYSALCFKKIELGIASENLFSKTGESIVIKLSCVF
tara:strand:+ start:612 stop:1823 length:1212 start_codon:yes stop_codon:yes gene_type:complete